MVNKFIVKIDINTEDLRKKIEEAGYTINRISKEIGKNDKTVRYYLKKGQMPETMLDDIMNVIEPKTRKVWMRIGATVPVTEDELYTIMNTFYKEAVDLYGWLESPCPGDYIMTETEAADFLKRGIADGETHIPGECFDEHLDWFFQEKQRREGNPVFKENDVKGEIDMKKIKKRTIETVALDIDKVYIAKVYNDQNETKTLIGVYTTRDAALKAADEACIHAEDKLKGWHGDFSPYQAIVDERTLNKFDPDDDIYA